MRTTLYVGRQLHKKKRRVVRYYYFVALRNNDDADVDEVYGLWTGAMQMQGGDVKRVVERW